MSISRRAFGLGSAALVALATAPAAVLAQAGLSADDQAVLRQAQTYLTAMTTAQGTVVETGPNSQRRTGRSYLQRPGKMRFEYTEPEGLLVVADGNNVSRWDPRLNVFRQAPLGQTPLSTFLAREVRLDQGVTIDRVTRMDSGAFAITARDAKRPNEGSVILAFAGSPVRLQEWTITDAQGLDTTIMVFNLRSGVRFTDDMFKIDYQRAAMKRKGQ